jgi:hypothetical protein
MTDCPPHPPIGPTGDSTGSIVTTTLAIYGVLSTVITVVGKVTGALGNTTPLPVLGTTGAGVWVIALGAVAGAAAVILTVGAFLYDRCISNPSGEETCSAGVIDAIEEAFSDTAGTFFPFAAQHDMVSVVTQCQYWPMIQQGAAYVYVNTTDDSPEIHCYFKNSAVCAAGAGALIGAVALGALGVALGIAAGAALGCVASGPFYPLCLILACLIAAVVAATIALIGAMMGGAIGAAIAGSSEPATDDGSTPKVGDYITTCGKTIIYGADQGARVYWFVEHSALHGHSMAGAGSQWIHTDPDQNMPSDTCAALCPDNYTGGGGVIM